MASTIPKTALDGWHQIRAGLELIVWSRLASWSMADRSLIPAQRHIFESDEGWRLIHKEFGRLICWISFGVGSEYVVRGTLMVYEKFPSDPSHFKLGGCHPWTQILKPGTDVGVTSAAIKFLAKEIRNRDAHCYTQNVRESNFEFVDQRFIPALNHILSSLDQDKLHLTTASTGQQF